MNLGERNPVSHEPLSSTQNYALVLIFSGCEFSKFLKTVTFSAKPTQKSMTLVSSSAQNLTAESVQTESSFYLQNLYNLV